MSIPAFHDWLQNRSQESSAADRLATIIASAGAAGISYNRLRRGVHLSPETLTDVLKGLVTAGQVMVMKVGGQTV